MATPPAPPSGTGSIHGARAPGSATGRPIGIGSSHRAGMPAGAETRGVDVGTRAGGVEVADVGADSGGGRGPVVIAADKFKGTLTAAQVAEAITRGLRRVDPGREVRAVPVADGGDGTRAAVVAAGFTPVPVTVRGPTGEPVDTAFAVRDGVAVVELADACGLVRLPGGRPAPLESSSFGAGQVLRAALVAGYSRIILGVGGSASSDGGAGMLAALGAVLRDRGGEPLPLGGGALASLDSLDLSGLLPQLADAEIVLASDVTNPLLGPSGAVAVFGPQKGAVPGPIADRLEAGLGVWARVVAAATGRDRRDAPGAGAAGGVGFAALALLGAAMRPGIELILELGGFATALAGAALAITGEGALDAQTLQGKAPAGVARAASSAGVPVVAVCGHLGIPRDAARAAGFSRVYALTDIEPDVAACRANAGPLLERLAEHMARELFGWPYTEKYFASG